MASFRIGVTAVELTRSVISPGLGEVLAFLAGIDAGTGRVDHGLGHDVFQDDVAVAVEVPLLLERHGIAMQHVGIPG